MARTISSKMSSILEEFELEGITYVTLPMLDKLVKKYSIKTQTEMVAKRLREKGWLLPTEQRGIWEYVPAAVAGTISNNDPLSAFKVFNLANPQYEIALSLQSAAWALGLADRIPSSINAVVVEKLTTKTKKNLKLFTYKTNLPYTEGRGVNCLSPEAIIVHIASDPKVIKYWNSAMEWIPNVVYEIKIDNLMIELKDRTTAVKIRTGYFLQGMYPEASRIIYNSLEIKSKNRFGQRNKKALRNDERWKIVDTILPVNPREMEQVK